MKKFALVLALLAIAGFVFADTVVVPTLSGSANTTFGVNLNDPIATGFETSAEAVVAFTLIDAQSGDMMGEDNLYGEISISGFKVTGDNDSIDVTSASASAKIVAGDLYVTIGADPAFKTNKAAAIEKDNDDVAADPAKQHGLTIGLSSLGLALKVSSQDSYVLEGEKEEVVEADYYIDSTGAVVAIGDYNEDDTTNAADTTDFLLDHPNVDVFTARSADAATNSNNSDNLYTIGLDYSLALGDMGSIAVYASYAMAAGTDDATIGFGLGAPLTFGPASVALGFDGQLVGSAFDYDASLNLGVTAGPATLGVKVYMGDLDADDLDIIVSADLSALADPLTLTIGADLFNMVNVINLDLSLAYDVNGIKPYATLGIDDLSGDDMAISLSAGAELAAAATGIDNTTIKLDYSSTDLGGDDNGTITAGVTIKM